MPARTCRVCARSAGLRAGRADRRRSRRALVPRRTLRLGVRGCEVVVVEHVRYQWDDGRRRLEAAGEGTARSRHLLLLVDAVLDELRRRVGHTYTVNELAAAYRGSEEWVREVVLRETPPKARAGVRDTTLVQDA